MENTIKATKRDRFNQLLAIVNAAEIEDKEAMVEFINHEIELIDKRHGNSSKASEETKQKQAVVFNCLENCEKPVTVTELQNAYPEDLEGFTNQRISSYLRNFIKEGRVVKTTEKGKSYFAIA